jgi:hypothetical protein
MTEICRIRPQIPSQHTHAYPPPRNLADVLQNWHLPEQRVSPNNQ